MSKPLRALIVEDSEDDALLLLRQLRRGGYEPEFRRVDTAAAMRVALDEGTWDVVISDYAMPMFSAFAALAMLKDRRLDVPFIVVSGAIGEETAVAAMKSGAHDYIMKDNLKRLAPAIDRELRDAEVRRENRRAQDALLESEERYRSLVQNLDMSVTLIDKDFKIIMKNAASERMFGWSDEDPVGRPCFETRGKGDSACQDCPAIPAMATGRTSEREMEGVMSDGSYRVIRMRAFPVRGQDGQVSGCIEVAEDITDRKRLERQLAQAAQMEAIGRLAGGVAHDFNNLLTAMMGYSDVLLRQMSDEEPYREKVAQITYAAERAARLTRQLLAFGRDQVTDVRAFELNPVITEFESMLRRLLGEDVELATDLSPWIGPVKADRSRIEQILMNLAVNARDAMPSGGRLTLRTADVVVDAEYAKEYPQLIPGQYTVMSVSDTGVGMDQTVLSRIFDPFFTTKGEGKGTGLGLSTVYSIVKQHNGHISVRSSSGVGTVFEVFLPTCVEVPEAAEQEGDYRRRYGGSETALVVEDEEIVRTVAAELLEIMGYSVLSAEDFDTAVKTSANHEGPINLLVADVVLPRLNGANLFRTLSETRPEMRVLYISGYPESRFHEQGLLSPGAEFLQKPFTVEGLGRKVREVLERDPSDASPACDDQAAGGLREGGPTSEERVDC